jgi:hypothetical protein
MLLCKWTDAYGTYDENPTDFFDGVERALTPQGYQTIAHKGRDSTLNVQNGQPPIHLRWIDTLIAVYTTAVDAGNPLCTSAFRVDTNNRFRAFLKATVHTLLLLHRHSLRGICHHAAATIDCNKGVRCHHLGDDTGRRALCGCW